MSLLNTLKAVQNEGFDPRTGKINDGGLLPAGRYPVRLLTSDHDVNLNNNREQVVLTLQVSSGSHKDRQERLFLVFDKDLPEFVIDQNAKILLSVAAFTGVKLSDQDLANESTTAEAMKRGIGNQFMMDLKIRENKRNPEYPYRNYEFEEIAITDTPVQPVGEADFPF